MSDIETKIREEAKRVLESGDVSVVIGWGAGSVPFKTTPVFIGKPEDADKLVWNPACVNNLAVYLPRMAKDKKVGIVAKPCDIRSIIALIQEKQIKRENVHIIGLGCGGVVDAANLDDQDFHLRDVTALEWVDDGLNVTTTSGSHILDCGSCLRDMCIVCTKREPAICDAKLGEAVEPQDGTVCALPELPEDRRKYWSEQFRSASAAMRAARSARTATARRVSRTESSPSGPLRKRPPRKAGCSTRPGHAPCRPMYRVRRM